MKYISYFITLIFFLEDHEYKELSKFWTT